MSVDLPVTFESVSEAQLVAMQTAATYRVKMSLRFRRSPESVFLLNRAIREWAEAKWPGSRMADMEQFGAPFFPDEATDPDQFARIIVTLDLKLVWSAAGPEPNGPQVAERFGKLLALVDEIAKGDRELGIPPLANPATLALIEDARLTLHEYREALRHAA